MKDFCLEEGGARQFRSIGSLVRGPDPQSLVDNLTSLLEVCSEM